MLLFPRFNFTDTITEITTSELVLTPWFESLVIVGGLRIVVGGGVTARGGAGADHSVPGGQWRAVGQGQGALTHPGRG